MKKPSKKAIGAASIQTFIQREVPTVKPPKPTKPVEVVVGDGFTSSEIEAALHPTLHKWQPRCEYKDVDIDSLVPGPGYVAAQGRVVNLFEQPFASKMPHAAKGCLNLLVKDDTGVFRVKLHFAKVDYGLRLGHLVSIWTPHISNADATSFVAQKPSLVTSIFPERDNSCYLMVQENSDEGVLSKCPLGYREGKPLAGLMTLKNYIEGGHEVKDAKVLLCVKSIGAKKKFLNKKGVPCEKIDVHVFDNTADAIFTLWGSTGPSASYWRPSHTILLLSYASFTAGHHPSLSMNRETHVDVDPLITDACWLRGHAETLTKRENVNQPFPDGVFDVEEAASAEIRILFTLADIDEFARLAPSEHVIGYLNLTIVELNIFSLYQRERLLCAECCGVPLFANTAIAKCKQCEKDQDLRINPRLVGLLIDESGGITSGKLIWSEDAWWQLLGRTKEELAGSSGELLKYLDDRLLFLKIVIIFGWATEVGKLVVLRLGII